MPTNCHDEILELHEFFESWMTGGKADFPRFSRVMAGDFEMISPDGSRMDRDVLLSRMRDLRGTLAPDEFTITVKNIRVRSLAPGLFLAGYEEWQTRGAETKARFSTAVFREKPEHPNQVEWVHVHETWLRPSP